MSVTTPPGRTETEQDRSLEQRVSELEALIEEARRRARRRRAVYAVLVLAVLAGGVWASLDIGAGGGVIGSPSAHAGSAGAAASATGSTAGRWGPSHGPYGGSAYSIAAAPSDPEIVYVGTRRGVFASANGGRSWHSAGLAAPSGLLSPGPRITSLAVDPHAPATVYATSMMSTDGGFTIGSKLFKTTNGGHTWHALGLAAQRVAVSPADAAIVYAVVGSLWDTNRLYRSADGGRSWQPADRQLPATHFFGVAFDPATPATVYAASGLGVLTSFDGGSTWRRGPDTVSRQVVSAVAVDPKDAQVVYAGTDAGVIKSIDGGRDWRLVNSVMGSHGRDRAYGQISSLVVDPLESRTVYAATRCAGIFKSADGGRTWRKANAGRSLGCEDSAVALLTSAPNTLLGVVPGRGVFESTDAAAHWHAANTGLALTRVTSVAVDPDDAKIVYAGAGSLGLFKSSDGGATWRAVALGVVDAVAVDPRNPRVVLAAEAMHKVIRSTDGGRTWRASGAGIAVTPWALAIGGGYAYATTFSRGVYSSSDGGRTWRAPASPLDRYGQALAIAPDDPAVVYAAGGPMKAPGLYKSSDAGQSWRRLGDARKDASASAVALDPEDPTTIYLGTGDAGVFKSSDGGSSWRPAGSGIPRIKLSEITPAGKTLWVKATVAITALAVDPAAPTTIYAATRGRGVFRSTDAGATWHPLNAGLDVLDITSLALDNTGRTLYAGTDAGVVALETAAR